MRLRYGENTAAMIAQVGQRESSAELPDVTDKDSNMAREIRDLKDAVADIKVCVHFARQSVYCAVRWVC